MTLIKVEMYLEVKDLPMPVNVDRGHLENVILNKLSHTVVKCTDDDFRMITVGEINIGPKQVH